MDHERTLAASPFPDDDGQPAARTRERLAEFAVSSDPTAFLRAVVALCEDRVLVPVVATAVRMGTTVGGLTSDKEAEMSVVLLEAADGRRAMLVFTGLDALQIWDARARPVPITLDLAAKTALAEGAAAVLVDVAGPHPLALESDVLAELAAGHRLVELPDGSFGWMVEAPPPRAPRDSPGLAASVGREQQNTDVPREASGDIFASTDPAGTDLQAET